MSSTSMTGVTSLHHRISTTGSTTGSTTKARRSLQPSSVDFWLCVSVGVLLSLGLVLVYSSSAVHAAQRYGDAEHFIKQQLVRALIGIGILVALRVTPRQWLADNAGWILIGGLLLCSAVLVPGLGLVRGGARRWLSLGGVGFQPSELVKLAVVIGLAAILARREARSPAKRGSLLVPVLIAQLPVVLILAEPDLGTALVIELIVATMVFVAGVRVRTLALLMLAALPIFYHLVVSTPFRLRRLLAFIDPWAYRHTVGYQLSEALISTGSGGITGLGIGEGKHGLFFLPEAHTDFIFAILGQELGLVGVLSLLSLFALLLWRVTRIALRASSRFDRYLAIGLAATIGIPAVFNTCVVTGLLPTKGLPLPLVSYGGSNLIATLAAIGLILRIDRDTRLGEETGDTP